MSMEIRVGRRVFVERQIYADLSQALIEFVERHRDEILQICERVAPRQKLAIGDLSPSEYEHVCEICLQEAVGAAL